MEFNQDIFNIIPNPVFINDTSGRYVYCNSEFEKIFGVTLEKLKGKTIFDFVVPEIAKIHNEHDILLYSGKSKTSFESSIGKIHAIITKTLLYDKNGEIIGIIGVITDITPIKMMEMDLKESERKCREFANLLPQTVYELDINGIVTYINDAAYKMFGLDCNTIKQGFNFLECISPEDRDRALESFNKIIQNVSNIERGKRYMALRYDNKEKFPILVYSTAIRESNGNITGVRGIVIDNTDNEAIINELREAQETFRNLSLQYQYVLDTIPDMVWTKDINNKFTFANKALRETLNKETDEIIGKSIFDITETTNYSYFDTDEIVKKMHTCQFTESFKVDGKEVWLDVIKFPMLKDGELIGTIGFAKDITSDVLKEKIMSDYIDKEVEKWTREQEIFNNKIEESLNRIKANIGRLRENDTKHQ